MSTGRRDGSRRDGAPGCSRGSPVGGGCRSCQRVRSGRGVEGRWPQDGPSRGPPRLRSVRPDRGRTYPAGPLVGRVRPVRTRAGRRARVVGQGRSRTAGAQPSDPRLLGPRPTEAGRVRGRAVSSRLRTSGPPLAGVRGPRRRRSGRHRTRTQPPRPRLHRPGRPGHHRRHADRSGWRRVPSRTPPHRTTTLQGRLDRGPRTAGRPGPGRGPTAQSRQRQHDALIEMARRSAADTTRGPAAPARTRVLLHMDYQTFLAELNALINGPAPVQRDWSKYLCELDDRTRRRPLPSPWVRRWPARYAASSSTTTAKSSSSDRSKRLFTPALAEAIGARDRECQMPGCHLPAVRCQIDHRVEWHAGGTTDLTNGGCYCPFHNRWKHANPEAWQRIQRRRDKPH